MGTHHISITNMELAEVQVESRGKFERRSYRTKISRRVVQILLLATVGFLFTVTPVAAVPLFIWTVFNLCSALNGWRREKNWQLERQFKKIERKKESGLF